MYVWRFPVLLFAPFAVTAALLIVSATLLAMRGAVANRAARGVLLALVAAMLMASSVLVSAAIDALEDMDVHPSPLLLWAPAAIVPIVLVLMHRLFPSASARGGAVLRYRAACIATLIALGALNITNWCSPGWCERYGFPFPYSWWSDAILIMNGENWSAGFSALALFGNVTAAALAAVALARAYRRA